MRYLAPTQENSFNSLQPAERFYQHYTGVAAITQEREAHLTEKGFTYLTRRIGSTVYKVKVCFSADGETMEDKIMRMIQNEALTNGPDCGTIKAPQMSRRSERSA